MGTVEVVNKYKHTATSGDVYIGRGSPFGSPFSHLSCRSAEQVPTKEDAVDLYIDWFYLKLDGNNELRRHTDALMDRVIAGEDIKLVCYCKPKLCHGDVIKEYLIHELCGH